MNAMCPWEMMWQKRIRESYESRSDDPDYPALVAEAKARGYEPAPLNMLLFDGYESELYGWRGRLWIKSEDPQQALSL